MCILKLPARTEMATGGDDPAPGPTETIRDLALSEELAAGTGWKRHPFRRQEI